MSNLISLTAELVSAHAINTQMSSEELYQEIGKVYAALKALEIGTAIESPDQPKQLTIKQAFKKDEVICMICGKGFKTLKRHIAQAHDLKPGAYRKQFGIPASQSLVAKSYSESRRQTALDKGLGEGLAKAREARVVQKSSIPAVKTKVPVPTVKKKALVSSVKKKAIVPVNVEAAASVKAKKAVNVKAQTKSNS